MVVNGGLVVKQITDPVGWGASLNPDGSLRAITGPSILVSPTAPEGAVVANVGSLCIVNDPGGASLWLKQTGSGNTGWIAFPTSAGSGKGNLDILQAYIDSTSAAAITLGTLNAGDVVEGAEIDVSVAFDGTLPVVSIGYATGQTAYVDSATLAQIGVLPSDGAIAVGTTTVARAYLSLGGSATGSARVALSVRRA